MPRAASLDEFMETRRSHVGKSRDGKEVVFKGFKAPASYDEGTRSAEFIVSSESIDRDGDIVRQRGLDLSEFKKNPIALLFHSSRNWPIGQWSDVKRVLTEDPKHHKGRLNFLPAGGPVPEVDQADWMVRNGALRAVSIGFIPTDIEMIEHKDGQSPYQWGYDILKSQLLEISLVSVPANQDALAKDLIQRDEMAPAREFVEQALDDWAKDPRTGMLIPKKELESVYKSYFGKQYGIMMAVDGYQDPEKSALVRVTKAVHDACEEKGIKQPVMIPGEPVEGGGGIEAISGISINISIAQGDPGANTRVGTDIGDEGTASADANVNNNGVTLREAEPEHKEPHPLLVRAKSALKRFFGEDAAPPPEPQLVPGAYAERKDRMTTALECLRQQQ